MLVEPHQLDLFSKLEVRSTRSSRPDTLLMDSDALVMWKFQIATYQQRARCSKLDTQGTLFDLAPIHVNPDVIDPFTLTLQSIAFWRWPADSPGNACLYFVIDTAADILLYVGETCRSIYRWKGEHGCKQYIEKYLDLHYRYRLSSAVNVAFWWNAPMQRKPRQQLELALIEKWQSPFNKENWTLWGRPFE